jgi:hypothetical protein
MIRPIDISLNIQHAADAVRAGTAESQSRPEVAAQQYADRLEKQARLQEQQVHRKEASEKGNVNPDRKGHGGGYEPKRKPAVKKGTDKGKAPLGKPTGESMLDIRI